MVFTLINNIMVVKNLIVRILGNDLDNLHGESQTIDNLLFTLNNEPKFENTTKLFLLNRILNKEKRKHIIDILTSRDITFFELEFNYEDYKKIPILTSNITHLAERIIQGESITVSDKKEISVGSIENRRYIMNINNARNWCIDYGKRNGYTWTFVFDSNAFLTNKMYDEIIHNIKDETEYISIPQIRLSDSSLKNDDILNSPDKLETLSYYEHQLAFKNTSIHMFNPEIPYGTMDKGEMLNALSVPGIWETWLRDLDFISITQRKFTNVKCQILSKVIRLDPGNNNNSRESNWTNRMAGTYKLIKYIETLYT